jgi:hypothetical protein
METSFSFHDDAHTCVPADIILNSTVQKMRKNQQYRLKELRIHERLNSVNMARRYRHSVEKASQIMRRKLAEEAEEERLQV